VCCRGCCWSAPFATPLQHLTEPSPSPALNLHHITSHDQSLKGIYMPNRAHTPTSHRGGATQPHRRRSSSHSAPHPPPPPLPSHSGSQIAPRTPFVAHTPACQKRWRRNQPCAMPAIRQISIAVIPCSPRGGKLEPQGHVTSGSLSRRSHGRFSRGEGGLLVQVTEGGFVASVCISQYGRRILGMIRGIAAWRWGALGLFGYWRVISSRLSNEMARDGWTVGKGPV